MAMKARTTDAASLRLAHFIVYIGVVLTIVSVLFPPFASMNGTEYAFLLTGPEWARSLSAFGADLGIVARIDWFALLVQLSVLWLVVLGGWWFLAVRNTSGRAVLPALAMGCISLVVVPVVMGQAAEAEDEPAVSNVDATVGLQGGRYGVGFASSWPTYGLSGTIQLSETLTAEAVVGFLGTISSFGGRAWYRFNRNPNYDLYGYGSASLYQYRYTTLGLDFSTRRATENVLGLGGGVGIEAGIQTLLKNDELPPVFLNWEIGLGIASFDHYNFSSFVFGGGIRYRFGAR